MFPSDLDNAYAYAMERRKDELHYAAKRRLEREARGTRAPISLPKLLLNVLTFLFRILIH